MLNRIENLVVFLMNDFLSQGFKTDIYLNNIMNNDVERNGNDINLDTMGYEQRASLDRIRYSRFCSRKRFALFLYVLAEVHELVLYRSHCTYRQLYYRSVTIQCNRMQIKCAVNDVCRALGVTSWNLGIFAAGKCFIAGPILVHMSNGDVIDCAQFKGATLLPPNFTYIDKFETTAKYVLIVEKNTVFQNLVARGIFSLLSGNIILLSARGYPDICTRWVLHKLWAENNLIMYSLVDCDPFGIEIMIIYRYGSMAQGLNTLKLICPQLKWLGIHPSEINHLTSLAEPLSTNDHDKIKSLLCRSYLDDEIRKELVFLQLVQCKMKIDNMSPNIFSTFIIDYIINKIKRQILL